MINQFFKCLVLTTFFVLFSNSQLRAEISDAGAQFTKAQELIEEKEFEEAASWYLKAAEQGHAQAQYELAILHQSGQGVEQLNKEALNWYTKAAEQGHAGAQNNLGAMYNSGMGTAFDPWQAARWFEKAAQQDLREAQENLGLLYKEGHGVEEDLAQAYFWYKLAADKGSISAKVSTTSLYVQLDKKQKEKVKQQLADWAKTYPPK